LIRVAIPDFKSVDKIKEIKRQIKIPLIADIHFNHRLAIESIKAGADKIRINPGNIGGVPKVKEVVKALKDYGIPMRVGANSGSLEPDLLKKYGKPTAIALSESICRWVKIIEDMEYDKMVLSVKSSDPIITIEAYRIIAKKLNYPLHLGVTAVSLGLGGMVKSVIGIGSLLADGIGDTIRVSLTGKSIDEVRLGNEILKSLGLRDGEVQIIACPTCGRCGINVESLVKEVEAGLNSLALTKSGLRIAVMGCVVNGPGEARDVDFGITGSGNIGVIFKKGEIIKKVPKDKIVATLLEEIKKYFKTR
jgi:(E)-4-hydroxy-3-methylbut-2-enyl-diphosphate synthase